MNAIIGRVSLRVVLTAVFAVLLTVMAGITWLLTFRNGRLSVAELADQVGRLSMVDIGQHIEGYISVPVLVDDMNAFAFAASAGVTTPVLSRRFAAELGRFDSVVSIAFADRDGNYVGMSRGIEGIPLALALSDASTSRHLVGYRSDSQARRGAAFDRSSDPFDARDRPWYQAAVAADKPAWTPVYLWLTGDAGVDLVAPVRDAAGNFQGVLDASLTLAGIGQFLAGLHPTPHSQSFIIERSGLLIATSTGAALYRHSSETLHRFSGLESDDPTVRTGTRALVDALQSGDVFADERQFRLRVGRSPVLMRAKSIRDGRGLDWIFAEVIPESDFAQRIYGDVQSTVVFVLLFLAASMAVALVVARRISAPLNLLRGMARRVAAGDMELDIEARGTGEVVELARSFQTMAEELRRSFRSLEESEARYRAFVSASDAGIFRLESREPLPLSQDPDEKLEWFYHRFTIAESNDTAVRMVGASSSREIEGQGPDLFLPHVDPACLSGVRVLLRSPGQPFEFELVRRDASGNLLSLVTNLTAVVESGHIVRVWAVVRDVSERRTAEEALRRSEARLRAIFDRAAVSLWEADVSELHRDLEELRQQGVADVEGWLRDHPAFLAEELRKVRIVDVNQRTVELFEARSRQELLGPLSLPFDAAALSTVLPAAIAHAKSATPLDIETTVTTRTGRLLDVMIHFHLPAAHDVLRNMLVSVVDITARTRAERERQDLQDQLRHAQKVETLGRLAGGISHDINNLLTPILGGAELLALDGGSAAPPETAEQIAHAARRIKDLTQKLLAFSRKQELSRQTVHLGTVVSDFQKLLRRTLRRTIDIRCAEAGDTALVRVDVGQMEQVLMNLAVNAQDAMPDGGTLSIDLRNAEDEGFVQLTVTDTGTGMTPEARDHVFEPFFTTKGEGRGTGLGLSTVFGIVKQHGGHILVDTEPGRGTSFRVFLPRHAGD